MSDAPLQRRPPTMRDVADRAGVSRQLVSLVMRGLDGPSSDSQQRIRSAAAELGYRPNASARQLRQTHTKLIGLHFTMRNAFQVRVAEFLLARANSLGYSVVLGPVTEERSTDDVLAELLEERVEAMAVFNPDPESELLAQVRALMPTVWLGEWTDVEDVDNVHVDEQAGLDAAVDHLIGLGHQRIAYVGGEGAYGRVAIDRADAYRSSMKRVGLEQHIEVLPSDFSEEGGAAVARALLGATVRPTALICCGDQVAAGAMAVFAASGLVVPASMSVVGFDDSYVAGLSYLQMTTVHQDVDATVAAVIEVLLARLDGEEEGRIVTATPTQLVVRSSTSAIAGAS